jgi:hypothetical protein
MTYFTDHRIFYRSSQLNKWTSAHGLTERLVRKWETLDHDITKGCLHAERKCKTADRPAWSLNLHHAPLAVVYSILRIQSFRDDTPHHEQLHRLLSEDPTFIPPDITDLASAYLARSTAKALLRKIRKDAKAYRESFLEDRAAAAAAAQNLTAEQAIKIILQQ